MATKTIKSFPSAPKAEPLQFNIGDQAYFAIDPGRLPAGVLMDYITSMGEGSLYQANEAFFAKALLPESAELFLSKLSDKEDPITLHTMVQVAEWLINEYSAKS